MKRVLLPILALFLWGCAGEEVARERAELLKKQVLLYENDLDYAIQKERETYEKLANTYRDAWTHLGDIGFWDLGYIEALRFAGKMRREGDLSYGDLFDFLKKIADTEFQVHKDLQDRRLKVQEAHVKAASQLTFDRDKITEVRKALEKLSTEPGARERAENLLKIAMEVMGKIKKEEQKKKKEREKKEK